MTKKTRLAVLNALARAVPSKLARIRVNQKTNRALARQYGDLQLDVDWKALSVANIGNESNQVFGLVAKTIREIDRPIRSMLLAGEDKSAVSTYASIANIPPEHITTAGLHDGSDYNWNFENAAPAMDPFDCIVSHAILEHLIDPYKHIQDLCGLLQPRGHLVVFTVAPGFPYHRHPIDCMRFFPDWFETVADRLELSVKDRFFGDERIMYRFQVSKVTDSFRADRSNQN